MTKQFYNTSEQINKVYFDAAAWGMMYYIKMYDVIRENSGVGKRFSDKITYYGTSSGAIYVMMICIGMSSAEIIKLYDKYSEETIHKLVNFDYENSISYYQIQIMNSIIEKYPDAYEKMNSTDCHIGITLKNSGFRWISNFESNVDLINCLLCSVHIPQVSTYNAQYKGEIAMDGGAAYNVDLFFPEKSKSPNKTVLTVTTVSNPNYDLYPGLSQLYRLIPSRRNTRHYWMTRGETDLTNIIKGNYKQTYTSVNSLFLSLPIDWFWFVRSVQSIEYSIDDLINNK